MKRKLTVLGTVLLLAAGIMAMSLAPASALPPQSANMADAAWVADMVPDFGGGFHGPQSTPADAIGIGGSWFPGSGIHNASVATCDRVLAQCYRSCSRRTSGQDNCYRQCDLNFLGCR